MTIRIRPVERADYDWLLDLHHTVYRELIISEFGYWDDDEELGLFLDSWETKKIDIILKQNKPVGMFIIEQQGDYLWLDELQIEPQYQNQGIGTAVILQLICRARKLGLPLRLRVLHANLGAFRLYQKLGFQKIRRAEHHHLMEVW
ncbi:N-acetyltransferase [Nitrosomonas sp. Nm51]|uniref:GNAT family N-acetyltransferase n=1 Tax=Nitrosomonas sp. Nm51 TaxID=133720 RepID=UPI000B88E989|nr:GNAT family N-acetyltransferase [Nitrosomonas sp. Nm51]